MVGTGEKDGLVGRVASVGKLTWGVLVGVAAGETSPQATNDNNKQHSPANPTRKPILDIRYSIFDF